MRWLDGQMATIYNFISDFNDWTNSIFVSKVDAGMDGKIAFNPFRDNFIWFNKRVPDSRYISNGCCGCRALAPLPQNNYLVEHLDSARLFCAYYMHAYGINYVLQVVGAVVAHRLPHAAANRRYEFFGSDLNRSMVIMSMYRRLNAEWQEHSFGLTCIDSSRGSVSPGHSVNLTVLISRPNR